MSKNASKFMAKFCKNYMQKLALTTYRKKGCKGFGFMRLLDDKWLPIFLCMLFDASATGVNIY